MANAGAGYGQWTGIDEYLDGFLDPEELDRVREVLVYILVKETSMEVNDACSLVFGRGDAVTWH